MADFYEYEGRRGLTGFHLRDGLHFQRGEDGSVTIVKSNGQAFDPEILWELAVPAEEWASVVASMSVRGETGETWEMALNFHRYGAPVTTGAA